MLRGDLGSLRWGVGVLMVALAAGCGGGSSSKPIADSGAGGTVDGGASDLAADGAANPDTTSTGAGGSGTARTDAGDAGGGGGAAGAMGVGGAAVGMGGAVGTGGGMGTGGVTGVGGTGTGGATGVGGMGTGGAVGTGGATGVGGTPGTGGAGGTGTGGTGGTQPAVSLVMIANPDPAVPAGFIAYEIKLTNTTSSTLTNVVLTESTLSGANTLAAEITGGGGCGNTIACGPGTVVTWPAFTLAAGQTQTVTFLEQVLNATANGTMIHNTATATFPGGQVAQSRDVLVDGAQPLRLGISEDHEPVAAGDQLTYTVVAGNTGAQSLPLSAAGVVSASIPAGTTFVAASAGGTASDNLVQWNVGSIDAGGSRRFSFTVSVGAGLGDGTVLGARAEMLDGVTSLVRALVSSEVRAAVPVRLTMIANPDPAAPAGFVLYEIKLSNTSTSTLTNVVLSESTLNNANTLSPEITGGGGCGNTIACGPGVIVTWPAFTLAAGQTQTVRFLEQVLNGTPNGTLIRNAASVAYPGGTVAQSNDLVVNGAQSLRLGITEDSDPVKAGGQLTYTIVAGNTGAQSLPLSAAGVLTATIPPGTTFVSASPGGNASGGLVQWSVGSIDSGGDRRFSYTVSVGSTLGDGTVLPVRAELLDSTVSLVRAKTSTEIRAVVPVKLTMIVNPDPAVPAGFALYEIKLTNTTTSTLTNIVLSESTLNNANTLSPEITGGGGCGNSIACGPGVIVTWPAFTLAAGQTQTVSFLEQVLNGTLDGTLIRNDATVAYPGGTASQTYHLVANGGAGLRLGITEDHDPVKPGEQLTYTIVAGNTASQSLPLSAAGVLTATIPPGATFVSASTGGSAAGNLVQWNVGAIDAGGNRRFSYTVSIAGTLGDGTVLPSRAELLDGTVSQVRAMVATEVRSAAPIKLTLVANPDPVVTAGFALYEIRVSNTTTSTLSNVVLTESTLNNANTLSPEITAGGGCGNSIACGPGVIVTWPAFTLASGQTQTVSFLQQVLNGTLNGTLVRSAATAAYPGGTVSHAVDLVVNAAQALRLGINEDRDPVKPGEQLTYTIVAGNTGAQSLPLSAAGVLTATIPAGTTFVSASGGGTAAGSLVRWNIGSIDAGATRTQTFIVAAGASLADGTVLATQADLLDGAVSLVRSSATAQVKAAPPLQLSLSVTPNPAAPLGLANYVLAVTNVSAGTLSNVVLSNSIRNNANILTPSITGGGDCGNSIACGPGVIVTWPAFTLTAGQTQSVSFNAQVLNGTPDGTLIRDGATLTYVGGAITQGHDLSVHR